MEDNVYNSDLRKDIENVYVDHRLLGYMVRSSHFYGFVQEAPMGWMIARRNARTIEFQPDIYVSRLRAKEALIELCRKAGKTACD